MSKRILLVLVAIVAGFSIMANEELDSLLAHLKTLPSDTNKVWTYKALAAFHVQENPDWSLLYADSGIRLAKRIDFLSGEARCDYIMGLAYDFKGEANKSVEIFNEAKRIYELLDDQEWVGNCINSIGGDLLLRQ